MYTTKQLFCILRANSDCYGHPYILGYMDCYGLVGLYQATPKTLLEYLTMKNLLF